MSNVRLVVREPLLDSQQQVVGYQFSWMQDVALSTPDEITDMRALIDLMLNACDDEVALSSKYT